jgi:hypothetical protein
LGPTMTLMTSKRNERLLAHRAKLRDRQRQELTAVDTFTKLIAKELEARQATAAAVAQAVADFGKAHAAGVLGLEPREVNDYLKEHAEVAENRGAEESSEDATSTGAEQNGNGVPASIPAPQDSGDTAAVPA